MRVSPSLTLDEGVVIKTPPNAEVMFYRTDVKLDDLSKIFPNCENIKWIEPYEIETGHDKYADFRVPVDSGSIKRPVNACAYAKKNQPEHPPRKEKRDSKSAIASHL